MEDGALGHPVPLHAAVVHSKEHALIRHLQTVVLLVPELVHRVATRNHVHQPHRLAFIQRLWRLDGLIGLMVHQLQQVLGLLVHNLGDTASYFKGKHGVDFIFRKLMGPSLAIYINIYHFILSPPQQHRSMSGL